jgi:hypothetical protein
MPARQVIRAFNDLFLTDQFVINEATVLDFGEKKHDKRLLKSMNVAEFRTKVGNLRGLSLYLAQATVYRLRQFSPMTDIFHVSPVAMARRLEELNLVRY